MARPFSQNTSQHLSAHSEWVDVSAPAASRKVLIVRSQFEVRLQNFTVYCEETGGTITDDFEIGTIADPNKYGQYLAAALDASTAGDLVDVEMIENDVTLGDEVIMTTPFTAVAGIFTFTLYWGFTGPITPQA